MHKFKKWLYAVLGLIVILIVLFREIIVYGISQGYGQIGIIMNARPMEEVMNDPEFPDSLKSKLGLIQEIKKFAFDSLGINYSENYTSVYDQKGKPILWVVTASEPFFLKAKEWSFPIIGSFSYKGFFNYEKAQKEEEMLKCEGFDTSIDEVSGWSTLGWFNDPVLSEMLKKSPGSLANLIIHELTHGTLYVKDNVRFNENLASFVGDKGATKFLINKYGQDSPEYNQYIKGKIFMKENTRIVLKNADRLDSLYNELSKSKFTYEQKKQKKKQFLKNIEIQLKAFLAAYKIQNPKYNKEVESLNNTYFIDFRRYRENLDNFEAEYRDKFHSDIKSYMNYLKKQYPSL